MQKHVVLFGFEQFGKFERNYSGEIVKLFNKVQLSNNLVIGKVIPIRYFDVEQEILEILHLFQPEIVIYLQIYNGNSLSIEKYAINSVKGKFDDKKIKHSKIFRGLPDNQQYEMSIPINVIRQILTDLDIKFKINYKPTKFIANQAFFTTLNFIKQNQLPIQAGFIRIPAKNLPLKEISDILKYLIEGLAKNKDQNMDDKTSFN